VTGAIYLLATGVDGTAWSERFRACAPEREIRAWPEQNAGNASYACVWHPPKGVLASIPSLRAIFSMGAGVDHVLSDPALPDVPIARIVDPDLTMRMTEYVALHVLMHHRRQCLYAAHQRERLWREHDQPPASDVAVGIMGFGALGRDAAVVLARLGFQVAGWSRMPKICNAEEQALAVQCFCGENQLDAFLHRTEILVCLLPATRTTRGILNLALLHKLKRDGAAGGAFLINAGRGALAIEADILAALDEGTLAGATLDVFANEPLDPASPFWTHPQVTVTPHNAGFADPRALVPNVLRQIERFEAGLPLEHVVDRAAGY
jgi:glyoxylate/hydroxypyruvate reductase A